MLMHISESLPQICFLYMRPAPGAQKKAPRALKHGELTRDPLINGYPSLEDYLHRSLHNPRIPSGSNSPLRAASDGRAGITEARVIKNVEHLPLEIQLHAFRQPESPRE